MKSLLVLSLMMTTFAFANDQQEPAQIEPSVAAKKVLVVEEGAEEIAQAEEVTLPASE